MKAKGFTLVEVIVTITIIALLTVMVIGGFNTQQRRARDARRISDIEALSNGIQQFVSLGNKVPDTAGIWHNTTDNSSDFQALVTNGIIASIPQEQNVPAGGDYHCKYQYNAPTASWNDPQGHPLGQREYLLTFYSEVAPNPGDPPPGTTPNPTQHPLNNRLLVYGDNASVRCVDKYPLAILFGGVKQL